MIRRNIKMRQVIMTMVLLTLFSCSNLPYLYQYNGSNDLLTNRKIAIVPCNLLAQNKYSENQKINSETIKAIKFELENNQFQYVEGEEIGIVIDSLKKEITNFYNPRTGQPDTSEIHRFMKTSTEMIINKFGVTSVLYPYILVAPARVSNYAVRWHGRAYSIFPNQSRGQISALSLYIKIYDKNQKMIFDNAGGIQPLDEIYFYGIQKIDDNKLFKNSEDIKKAANIVFKPIREDIKNRESSHN